MILRSTRKRTEPSNAPSPSASSTRAKRRRVGQSPSTSTTASQQLKAIKTRSQQEAIQKANGLKAAGKPNTQCTQTSLESAQSFSNLLGGILKASQLPKNQGLPAMKRAFKDNKLGIVAALDFRNLPSLMQHLGLNPQAEGGLASFCRLLSQKFSIDVKSISIPLWGIDRFLDFVINDTTYDQLANSIGIVMDQVKLTDCADFVQFMKNFDLGEFEDKRELMTQSLLAYYGESMPRTLKMRILAGILSVPLKEQQTSEQLGLQRIAAVIANSGSFIHKLFQKIGDDAENENLQYLLADVKDNLPPLSVDDINKILYQRTKGKLVFDPNATQPIGAASIAQVALIDVSKHANAGGQKKVIAKILKPGARDITKWEKSCLGQLKLSKTDRTFIEQIFETIAEEMDFRIEASNIRLAQKLYRNDKLAIDIVDLQFTDLSSDEVLFQSLAKGKPLNQYRDRAMLTLRAEATANWYHTWLKNALDSGFFHGDPHVGNLLAAPQEFTVNTRNSWADTMTYEESMALSYEDIPVTKMVATPIDFGASGHMNSDEIWAAKWFGLGTYRQNPDAIMEALSILKLSGSKEDQGPLQGLIQEAMSKSPELVQKSLFRALEKANINLPRSFLLFFWSFDYLYKQIDKLNVELNAAGLAPLSTSRLSAYAIFEMYAEDLPRARRELAPLAYQAARTYF